MTHIEDPKLLTLIAELHAQNNVEVRASEGVDGVLRAFKNGETVKELAKFHSRFDSQRDRIFPGGEEDEGWENVESGDVDDTTVDQLISNVVVEWDNLNYFAISLRRFVYHLNELSNEIGALITYHPEFNYETGEIEPGYKDPFAS